MSANLTNQFGFLVTRSAIIGMWHRRGWTGGKRKLPPRRRASEPRQAVDLAKRVRVKIIAPAESEQKKRNIRRLIASAHGSLRLIETTEQTVMPLRKVLVEPLNVKLIDLQHDQCRYAYGDGPFLFCGHPIEPGCAYCPPHRALTYNKNSGHPETRSEHELRTRKHARAFRGEA